MNTLHQKIPDIPDPLGEYTIRTSAEEIGTLTVFAYQNGLFDSLDADKAREIFAYAASFSEDMATDPELQIA